MNNLIEGNLVIHERHKVVTLYDIMGKLSLIMLSDGNIIGVHTRLLKPIDDIDVFY